MAPKKRPIEPPSPPSSRRKALRSLKAMLSDDGLLAIPGIATADGGVHAPQGRSDDGDALDALQICAKKMISHLPRAAWDEVSSALAKRGTHRFASGCSGTDVWSECGEVLASVLAEKQASNVDTKTLLTCDKD